MTIQEMEYDVKFKLNKVDSNAFRGLKIPEIDWKLNEAQDIYINNAIASKRQNGLAFEINERITGDIAPLVVKATILPAGNLIKLPSNYRNFVKADILVKKGDCQLLNKVWLVQHEDISEYDYFSQPSFEWQEANGYFETGGLVVQADGTIQSAELVYVRKPKYMHNAIGFDPAGYRLPSGELLQGVQNSELPAQTHREIVDIAVSLIATELELPTAGAHIQKLTLTN